MHMTMTAEVVELVFSDGKGNGTSASITVLIIPKVRQGPLVIQD